MSRSDRLHSLTVVGGLLAALCLIGVVLYAVNKPAQQSSARQSNPTQQQPKSPLPSVATSGPVETNWRKPDCAQPKKSDEADLCQQIRMAEAAERSVTLSRWQLILGVIGAGLLFWTLRYNRQAAVAATVAAEAAAESAKLGRKSLQLASGPYLDIKDDSFKIHLDIKTRNIDIEFDIKNIGKSVAIIETMFVNWLVGKALPDAPNYRGSKAFLVGFDVIPDYSLHVGNDTTRNALNQAAFDSIISGQNKYFLYGIITYRDLFDSRFERGFVKEIVAETVDEGRQVRLRLSFPDCDASQASKFHFFREKDPLNAGMPAIELDNFRVKKFSPADGCAIDFRITNASDGPVLIQDVEFTYASLRKLRDIPEYRTATKVGPLTLVPGGIAAITQQPAALNASFYDDVLKGDRIQFMFGMVTYREESTGRQYEVGFVKRIVFLPQDKPEDGTPKKARVRVDTLPGHPAYNFFREKKQAKSHLWWPFSELR